MRTRDGIRYYADNGMFFLRKEDNEVMGDVLCLKDGDTIDNYYEHGCNEEGYKFFYESKGVDVNGEVFKGMMERHMRK